MKLAVQPVEGAADIVHFAFSVAVLSLAKPRTPKIEAQHGKSEAVQHLHGVEHNLVVQRPAVQGMRMADQRGVGRLRITFVQQGLKPACRTIEKQRPDRAMLGHAASIAGTVDCPG